MRDNKNNLLPNGLGFSCFTMPVDWYSSKNNNTGQAFFKKQTMSQAQSKKPQFEVAGVIMSLLCVFHCSLGRLSYLAEFTDRNY
jgi:hypothetical protein